MQGGSESMDDKQKHSAGGRDANILVLGMKGVGKSAMIVRFLTRRFIGDYDPDIEAIYSHSTTVDGKQITMHILDTAWEDTEKGDQIDWADAIMFVYSITDKRSFEKVRELEEAVQNHRPDERLPKAVVANKSDLIHRKAISDTDAAQISAEYNCLFFETSASDSYSSVANAFIELYKQIRLVHRKREKLSWFMQKPGVAAKLQIRQSLRNLADRTWRTRTSTV